MHFSTEVVELRAARSTDFKFAWSLYEELMRPLTEELLGQWNEPGQKQVVEMALAQEGAFIIVQDELDAGWMQVIESPDGLYLGQIYVAPPFQNRGIGTTILWELIDKVRECSKILTLDVMKNNRSRLLYERLGFQVVGQSDYKLKMQWREAAPHGRS
jgi:ribosomal protein S18 acetylase RimI-like enzyme